jgi:hypothetical protein
MTNLVGPVYIAHPYSAPTAEGRARNVEMAAMLSNAVNLLGAATVSPLQESYRRECALHEELWLEHGLVLLRVCKAIVIPRDYHVSSGCVREFCEAHKLGIPSFKAEMYKSSLESVWIAYGLKEWIKREQASV